MKKNLFVVGLLSAFGIAHAETSVTLYGSLNLAVQKKGDAGVVLKSQESRYSSHIGISGKEDLGNGYSAIFKLESEIRPDTGIGVYGNSGNSFGFNRQSYVGLITPFGAFRFGRSTTPFTNMWVGGSFGEGRGIGEFTGGLAGAGLRNNHPEVGIRWNNAFFYDIKKGGLTAGLAVTTKGSESIVPTRHETLYAADGVTPIAAATSPVNNEGASGTKPAYGLYTRYEGTSGMWGYKFGGAYQVDNGSSYATTANGKNAPAEAKRAWILAAATSYGSVKFDLGYAESRIDNNSLSIGAAPLRSGRSKTMFASVGYNITPLDHVYASYGRYQRKNDFNYTQTVTGLPTFSAYGEGEIKGTQISAGYEHRLSKRTLVYTNIRKVFNVTNSCAYTPAVASTSPFYKYSVAVGKGGCAATEGVVSSVLSVEKGWSYDIGLSHSF